MTELKRWKDEGAPPDFARLLRAARNERPSSESMQRALVAAGVIGATSLAAGSAAGTVASATAVGSAAGKGLIGVTAKLMLLSVIGGGAVVTSAVIVSRQHNQSSSTAGVASTASVHVNSHRAQLGITQPPMVLPEPSLATNPAPPPAQERAGAELQVAERAPPVPREAAKAASRGVRVAAEASRESDSNELQGEMALVDAARANLRLGKAVQAAKNCRDVLHQYPSGQLAPEALFILMQASQQLGQLAESKVVAREILARFPSSPQAGKARELVEIP